MDKSTGQQCLVSRINVGGASPKRRPPVMSDRMGVIKHSLRFDGNICEVVVVCVCAITIQQLSSPPSLHVQVDSSPFFPIAGLSRDLPPCHAVSQEIAEPGPEPNETKKNLTLLPRHSRDLPLNPQPRAGPGPARRDTHFLGSKQTPSWTASTECLFCRVA